ncbi:MAG: hypothetical protein NXH75_04995 [Halobacteriovoraceae bacterium]|nr:hypothetical protein [Halobacteriovoraceae bacterium]
MSKTEIISLRLKNEELEQLTGLSRKYGKTTSEKLRSLINLAHEGELKIEKPVLVKEKFNLVDASVKSDVINEFSLLHQRVLTLLENAQTVSTEQLEEEIIDELNRTFEKYLALGISTKPRVINNRYFLDGLLSLNKIFQAVEKFNT